MTRLNQDIHDTLAADDRRGCIPILWDGQTADRILAALMSSH